MALFATAALPASASMGIISADLPISTPLPPSDRRQYKYKIFKVKMQKKLPRILRFEAIRETILRVLILQLSHTLVAIVTPLSILLCRSEELLSLCRECLLE